MLSGKAHKQGDRSYFTLPKFVYDGVINISCSSVSTNILVLISFVSE
jgi:hypothetical protein